MKTSNYQGSSSLRQQVARGGGALHLLVGAALVELHELGQIELGLLEDLDLFDEDVLEGEDLGAVLGDVLDDGIGEPESNDILFNICTEKRKTQQPATRLTHS